MVPPSAGAVAARPDAYTTVPISVANNSLLFSLFPYGAILHLNWNTAQCLPLSKGTNPFCLPRQARTNRD
jgi:hypothetical protein